MALGGGLESAYMGRLVRELDKDLLIDGSLFERTMGGCMGGGVGGEMGGMTLCNACSCKETSGDWGGKGLGTMREKRAVAVTGTGRK
jgi:hypothetical protein